MQLYDCHVRLGDTTTSEVPKFEVTAAEIIIFRKIHGADSVVRIQPRKMDKRAHAAERVRLTHEYAPGLANRKLSVEAIFGHDHMPLPVFLDPAGEEEAAKAVEAKEAEEAAKKEAEKADFDAAVQAEVDRRMGESKANAAHAASNSKDGTLTLKSKESAKA